MLFEGGIYSFAIPLGRTIAGFVVGVMLGIVGGWIGITFNNFANFPWSLEVHRNIYIVGIGLGAGLGAYIGWVNLNIRWYLIVGSLVLVLIGALVGVFLGFEYGQITDPSYLGRRHTIDGAMHWGAPTGGIVVATAIGLYYQIRTHQQ